MPQFIVKVLLQDVDNDDVYEELDSAMAEEEGYPYLAGENESVFALPPDCYEFEVEMTADALLNLVKLITATIEKKYKLKKSPLLVIETQNLRFANLQQLSEEDFKDE